jgi:transposase
MTPYGTGAARSAYALTGIAGCQDHAAPVGWQTGDPITTYWAGPGYPKGTALDDAAASRLAKGGWNLVWCHEHGLDTAYRHGLRAHLYHPLLMRLDVLDNPEAKAGLDALISRVKGHPALYSYHLADEPDAGKFAKLGKIVAYLREKDPGTLAYINLLPTYASNKQLGTEGDKIAAYQKHLDRYVEEVKPDLISYDHYQFTRSGDAGDYFLNLELIRKKSREVGLPFLNIVQASSWVPGEAASPHSPRVPGPDELRFLVNTSLAYGAQGTASQPGLRGYDAGKKITGRKRHVLVDTMGNLLAVEITTADVQDRDGARMLMDGLKTRYGWLKKIWADGGYTGSLLGEVANLPRHRQIDLEIVKRSDKAEGFEVLPQRWIVERTFSWLIQSRRLIGDPLPVECGLRSARGRPFFPSNRHRCGPLRPCLRSRK